LLGSRALSGPALLVCSCSAFAPIAAKRLGAADGRTIEQWILVRLGTAAERVPNGYRALLGPPSAIKPLGAVGAFAECEAYRELAYCHEGCNVGARSLEDRNGIGCSRDTFGEQ
jgi:hypothetical protein